MEPVLMDKRGVPLEVGHTVAAATTSYKQTNLRIGEIEKINPETCRVTIRLGPYKGDFSVVNMASPGSKTSTLVVVASFPTDPTQQPQERPIEPIEVPAG